MERIIHFKLNLSPLIISLFENISNQSLSLYEKETVLKPSTENIMFVQIEQHHTAGTRLMSIDRMLIGMREEVFRILDLDKFGHGSNSPELQKV